jgi:H/ACA ribonucleoprotein complex subunit 3
MKFKIRYCYNCNLFTLKTKCPKCGRYVVFPKPPKFSLDDKKSKYRIKLILDKESNSKI